jgi:hypothetical protein
MINARAYPIIDFGYAFQSNSPYFTIVQRSAKDVRNDSSSSGDRNSLQVVFYFTRAMADDLAVLLSPEHLRSLLPANLTTPAPGNTSPQPVPAVIPDEY